MTGIVMGLAFMTNFSSLILLPFGIVHILLGGFANLDFGGLSNFYLSLREELRLETNRKILYISWLCLGFLLPSLFLLYYQYLIFNNPARSIHGYLFKMHKNLSPRLTDYFLAFARNLLQNLFSFKTGLFSYTPLLLYPFTRIFQRYENAEKVIQELDTTNSLLRRVLFRTMIVIQPLFILFYVLFQAKNSAEMGWSLSIYNLYSARYLLPVIFPLGYLLLETITAIKRHKTATRWFLWAAISLLFAYSIIINVTATLLGDWIFSVGQVMNYCLSLLHNGLPSIILQSRQLVDW